MRLSENAICNGGQWLADKLAFGAFIQLYQWQMPAEPEGLLLALGCLVRIELPDAPFVYEPDDDPKYVLMRQRLSPWIGRAATGGIANFGLLISSSGDVCAQFYCDTEMLFPSRQVKKNAVVTINKFDLRINAKG